MAGPRARRPTAWALGATLWFAVEGVPPFERSGLAATLTAILHDPPGRPVRAGPLEPVLAALLAKDPDHRPPAATVRQMLEAVATGNPGPTVPVIQTARLPADPVAAPAPSPAWGQLSPAPPKRRRADRRQVLPGWTAPPRRRRWGRRLLVAAALLLLLAVASNLGNDPQGNPQRLRLGDPVRTGSSSSWSVRSTAEPSPSARISRTSPPWSSSASSGWRSRTPAGRDGPSAAASSSCSTMAATATTPTWTRPSVTATGGCCPPT